MASWSPDRIEQLKKLNEAGLSASQMANELGGVTRNAVIGKIHRLGLVFKNATGRHGQKVAKVRKIRANGGQIAANIVAKANQKNSKNLPAHLQPDDFQMTCDDPEKMRNVSLIRLEEGECKWPTIMDGRTQLFCGNSTPRKRVNEFEPFCNHHHMLGKKITINNYN